jgi:ribosome-associated protein
MRISNNITLRQSEVEIHAIRASGPGGQNVNKVSTAVHLRFDIRASSLPDFLKARLISSSDARITSDGVIILKCSRFRTFGKNREDALERLLRVIRKALVVKKKRRPTKPSKGANERRLKGKSTRSNIKKLRSSTNFHDN